DVGARYDYRHMPSGELETAPDDGGGRRRSGPFGRDVLRCDEPYDRRFEVLLADGHDAIDQPLDRLECNRLRIGIPAEAVGERRTGYEFHQPSRPYARLKPTRHVELDAHHPAAEIHGLGCVGHTFDEDAAAARHDDPI